ncbi:hypothetical protein [Actinoplanes sp. NPDC049681]|uniref:hypothetical protein n=1 Tax=Actinoplanes sp. NPDC049681 TaxID=3363905 RepID=UPI0037983C28
MGALITLTGAAAVGGVWAVRARRRSAAPQVQATPNESMAPVTPSPPPASRRRLRWPVMVAVVALVVASGTTAVLTAWPVAADTRSGDAITLHGTTGEEVKISLARVTDPHEPPTSGFGPMNGHRWVSFHTNLHNTGTTPILAEPHKHARVLDTQGRWFEPHSSMTASFQPYNLNPIAPGWDIDVVILFEVPQTAELTKLRLTLDPSISTEVADWTLH